MTPDEKRKLLKATGIAIFLFFFLYPSLGFYLSSFEVRLRPEVASIFFVLRNPVLAFTLAWLLVEIVQNRASRSAPLDRVFGGLFALQLTTVLFALVGFLRYPPPETVATLLPSALWRAAVYSGVCSVVIVGFLAKAGFTRWVVLCIAVVALVLRLTPARPEAPLAQPPVLAHAARGGSARVTDEPPPFVYTTTPTFAKVTIINDSWFIYHGVNILALIYAFFFRRNRLESPQDTASSAPA